MKKVISIFKILIFLGILLCISHLLSGILKKPANEDWDASGLEYVHHNPNHYDVIFSGTSIMITNISVEELYLEYGIAGATVAEPEQPVYLSYYTLRDALEVQSPKVVLFDINALFYSEKKISKRVAKDEFHYLHFSLDGIRNIRTKYEALQMAKKISPEIDIFNYLIPLYFNHSNWEALSREYFVRESGSHVMNGNLMKFRSREGLMAQRAEKDTNYGQSTEATQIPDINLSYFLKMIELCEKKNTQLILVRGGGIRYMLTQERYNAVTQLAEEYDLPFVDLTAYEEEMGIDWRFDSADGNHHNIMGAKKWTDFLGEYLTARFDFEDRRLDPAYDHFKVQEDRYENAVHGMQAKIDLLSATTFEQYLDILSTIDTSENTILIAVSDDASAKLSGNASEKLRQLGLESSLLGQYQYSFAAVLDNGTISEKMDSEAVSVSGWLDNGESYKVVSGGALSGKSVIIRIAGEDYAQKGRGFNIVVYNKAYGEILSNVFFDTSEEENPAAARNQDSLAKQIEVSANLWQ